MTIWPFKKKAKQDSRIPFQLIWTGGGFSMVPYAINSYINGYTGNSAVYSIVTAEMDKFADIPFYVYKIRDRQKADRYNAMTKSGYNKNALLTKASAFDEVKDTDPAAELMRKPNTYQTEAEFRKMWLMFLKLAGLSPVYSNTGLVGTKPLSIHVLPPQWVTLAPDQTLMDAVKVYFSPMGAGQNELDRMKVYLSKYQNPDVQTDGSHLYGLSPLKAALLDLQGSNDSSKAMAKMYQNGGARGAFTPKQILNETQVPQLRTAINDWLNGTDNKSNVGGMSLPLDYHDIGLTSVDMELLKGRQMTDERLATVFKFPPALLRSDNKYDNADAALRFLVTNGIYSDLVSYREMWNQWLLPMFGNSGYYVDFDISILPEMQGDMQKLSEQAISLVKEGIINRNEARDLLKWDAVEDDSMNLYTVNGTIIPLADVMMGDVTVTEDYAQDSKQ
jgi:HK97 family phage portal protein